MPGRRTWLFKTEPDTYSIDDLSAEPDATGRWDGVRNYQARNTLRDDVALGDRVLVYHSSTAELGIAGIARVVRAAYPDPTQDDPASGRWVAVDVQVECVFPRILLLSDLRREKALAGMALLQRGQRLSIQPVTAAEWRRIKTLASRL